MVLVILFARAEGILYELGRRRRRPVWRLKLQKRVLFFVRVR